MIAGYTEELSDFINALPKEEYKNFLLLIARSYIEEKNLISEEKLVDCVIMLIELAASLAYIKILGDGEFANNKNEIIHEVKNFINKLMDNIKQKKEFKDTSNELEVTKIKIENSDNIYEFKR